MFWLGVLVVAALVWWFWPRSKAEGQAPAGGGVARIKGNGKYEVEVVGESHYSASFKQLLGSDAGTEEEWYGDVMLVLEVNNPHDKNAVAVQAKGLTLGYLNREMAREFRQAVASNVHAGRSEYAVAARVYAGGDEEIFSVQLDLPQA